jgi:hypothetical protein
MVQPADKFLRAHRCSTSLSQLLRRRNCHRRR